MVAQHDASKNLPKTDIEVLRGVLESLTPKELAGFLFELGYKPSPA